MIRKLYKEVCEKLHGNFKILLEPGIEHAENWIEHDTIKWEAEEPIQNQVNMLIMNDTLSVEEKILKIYETICLNYVYDDNSLSYMRKMDDGTFFVPDSYGKNINSEWIKKRKLHNRRNCIEISRTLAKSINEILKHSWNFETYDVCILHDETLTHYFVGLICSEYCITLDIDDFTQILDLTRIKTGLTIEGIKILNDPLNKFGNALKRFNEGKDKSAEEHIEKIIVKDKKKCNYEQIYGNIYFLKCAIQILKEKYNLDSTGMFAYLKEIIDVKLGYESRKKVWKEIEGAKYTRCLLVTIDDNTYLIDVTKEKEDEIFREFDVEELKNSRSKIRPYKGFIRNCQDEPYDGG